MLISNKFVTFFEYQLASGKNLKALSYTPLEMANCKRNRDT